MRQIIVPRGGVKTKPRALNFSLDFCRGSIIGIYDAEDAPAPDQIHKVAAHFAQAAPNVACVQGILDFYNARTNWLSRCFTVEYASWFRVILPGYEKLGLTVPLGGTTLFFRRDAIEELGGWDAHNVTEDADLGIRLARHGYKTELLHTVTEEEANCRFWPWIKQRSRWLKGYAMTYAVHMQKPKNLWRDLGPWRFFGVQALFLGTLSQFVLAPFLWSFWMFPLGLPHPMRSVLSHETVLTLGAVFLLSEAITVATGMVATSTSKHRWLWPWVPTLHFYYPLATLAALKGLWEMVSNPFYWDKTAHGIHDEDVSIDGEQAREKDGEQIGENVSPAPLQLGQHLRVNTGHAALSPQNHAADGAPAPQAAPLILYPAHKMPAYAPPEPLDRAQTQPKDRSKDRQQRAFAEAPAQFAIPDRTRDPISARGLTFGLSLERAVSPPTAKPPPSDAPPLRRALAAAAVSYEVERLRPAPKPTPPSLKGETAHRNPAIAPEQGSDQRPVPDPEIWGITEQKTPPAPDNAPGPPEWAYVAAFAEIPSFIPSGPKRPDRRDIV